MTELGDKEFSIGIWLGVKAHRTAMRGRYPLLPNSRSWRKATKTRLRWSAARGAVRRWGESRSR